MHVIVSFIFESAVFIRRRSSYDLITSPQPCRHQIVSGTRIARNIEDNVSKGNFETPIICWFSGLRSLTLQQSCLFPEEIVRCSFTWLVSLTVLTTGPFCALVDVSGIEGVLIRVESETKLPFNGLDLEFND